MFIDRTDPEKLRGMSIIWRKLHCLNYMQHFNAFERPAQQYMDAGYCLDRYSLIDASVEPKE